MFAGRSIGRLPGISLVDRKLPIHDRFNLINPAWLIVGFDDE
jgi:hypothetical protein